MANIHIIESEADFDTHLTNAAAKLVVIDFHAVWCGPCKNIAPRFAEFSTKYPKAVFLKVDVDNQQAIAQRYRVSAMPTFIFVRSKLQIDTMTGADPNVLEGKIKEHYSDEDEVESPIKGYVDLSPFLQSSGTECLNQSDEHPFSHATKPGPGYLESDCDDQLIIAIAFNQAVKLHSLRIDAPKDKGPKTVKLFINQMHTIDFDQAEGMTATQQLEVTEDDLAEGTVMPLRFVKFQNVQNITVFVKDNQSGSETTQIDYFSFIGNPLNTTNMNEFKRVAGKKGESH